MTSVPGNPDDAKKATKEKISKKMPIATGQSVDG
jgi:hypothetical protein